MYTNAFEKLKAPTNYNTRDISRHIQLLLSEGAFRDDTEPCRLILLSPSERLFEELMTPRDADYEADAVFSDEDYQEVMFKLTGIRATPVASGSAHGWLSAMRSSLDSPSKITRILLKKALYRRAADDPWLLQGAAALCTRAAIYAETNDSAHAHSAWNNALELWQKFFASAELTTVHCYAMQSDAATKEACSKAWKGFLSRLVQDIYTRCTVEYISQNDGEAINACLTSLKSSSVRLLEPTLHEKALAAVEPSISASLSKSTNLQEALGLWEGLPESFKTKPSILSRLFTAMSTETVSIDKGYGDYRIVEKAWGLIGGEKLMESSDIEIKAALSKYFDAVSLLTRNAMQEENGKNGALKMTAVKALLCHVDKNHTVATDPSGEKMTPATFFSLMAMKELSKDIEGISKIKRGDAKKKGAAMWRKIVAATPGEDVGGEMRKGITTTILLRLRERGDNDFMDAYLESFPLEQEINSEDLATLEDALDNFRAEKGRKEAMELLEAFSKGDPTSSSTRNHLSALSRFVAQNSGMAGGLNEAYMSVLKGKLIDCVNAYGRNRDSDAKQLADMLLILLPESTTFPAGKNKKLTMNDIRNVLSGNSVRPTPRKKPFDAKFFFGRILASLIVPGIVVALIFIFHWYPLATWFKVVAWIWGIGFVLYIPMLAYLAKKR